MPRELRVVQSKPGHIEIFDGSATLPIIAIDADEHIINLFADTDDVLMHDADTHEMLNK